MPNFKRLQPSDITVTPFKAYKKWNVTVDNQDSSSGYVSLEGINYTSHFYPTEETTPNGLYKRAIYNLVHKLHYKYENDPALTFTNNTREVLEKNYIKNFLIFAPLFNEIVLAFCITGPSAIGSENGNPNSMMSVPPLTRPLTIDNVVFSLGKPVIIYEINAFSFLDFNSLNLS